jgi:hypothetical protein
MNSALETMLPTEIILAVGKWLPLKAIKKLRLASRTLSMVFNEAELYARFVPDFDEIRRAGGDDFACAIVRARDFSVGRDRRGDLRSVPGPRRNLRHYIEESLTGKDAAKFSWCLIALTSFRDGASCFLGRECQSDQCSLCRAFPFPEVEDLLTYVINMAVKTAFLLGMELALNLLLDVWRRDDSRRVRVWNDETWGSRLGWTVTVARDAVDYGSSSSAEAFVRRICREEEIRERFLASGTVAETSVAADMMRNVRGHKKVLLAFVDLLTDPRHARFAMRTRKLMEMPPDVIFSGDDVEAAIEVWRIMTRGNPPDHPVSVIHARFFLREADSYASTMGFSELSRWATERIKELPKYQEELDTAP